MTDSKMRAEFEAWALLGRPASAWDNWQLCWQAARQSALEEAIRACESEHLEDPQAGTEDIAYDHAIDHCTAAIRQLAAAKEE